MNARRHFFTERIALSETVCHRPSLILEVSYPSRELLSITFMWIYLHDIDVLCGFVTCIVSLFIFTACVLFVVIAILIMWCVSGLRPFITSKSWVTCSWYPSTVKCLSSLINYRLRRHQHVLVQCSVIYGNHKTTTTWKWHIHAHPSFTIAELFDQRTLMPRDLSRCKNCWQSPICHRADSDSTGQQTRMSEMDYRCRLKWPIYRHRSAIRPELPFSSQA